MMKLIQCVTAYMATTELMQKEWDYKTAYALVRLRKKLQMHVDFYSQQERMLTEAYGEKDDSGRVKFTRPGVFNLADPAAQEEYQVKKRELDEVEVEEEWKVFRVPQPASIKPAHLEALDGFIQFGEAAEEEQV